MRLLSHEVRWFFDGEAAPHGLDAWFRSFKIGPANALTPVEEPRRRDDYVVVPDHDDLGIKWRKEEGKPAKIEFKGRVTSLGGVVFANGVQGVVERWAKWSYEGERVEGAFAALFSESGAARVLAVGKRRWLRKARFGPGSPPVEVPASDKSVDRGVGVELTELDIDGRVYSSVGFEAFPDDGAMAEDFHALVRTAASSVPADLLRLDNSMSYPAWLLRSR